MPRTHRLLVAIATCAAMLTIHSASAHGVAGARIFVTTLTIDDPSVADEASLPTVTYLRQAAGNNPGPSYQVSLGGEYDKRITEHFGFAINNSYNIVHTQNDKTRYGFQDLVVTAKYQTYVNAEHEFLLSLGVIREFGRTGALNIGADNYGYTQPNAYFGKGLGDLPIGYLRPLAITGTFGYLIADKALKITTTTDPDTGLSSTSSNGGFSNRWVGGLTLQYSVPYLQSQVKDLGLPKFFASLTPLVELSWSSATMRPNNLGTQLLFAPGVIYSTDWYQVGVEALIPANRATGSNVGVIAQFHVFLDDLFPDSLGKPVVDWFK